MLIATVNSFDVGLLVVVQPFSTSNVCVCFYLKVTLTFLLFVLQLLFITLGGEYKVFIYYYLGDFGAVLNKSGRNMWNLSHPVY